MNSIYKFLSNSYYRLIDVYLRKKGFIYSPKAIHTQFYLPYVKTDLIQKYIYSRKTYFDYNSLNTVCKQWRNGAVSETLQNSITLDIGSNIGNHTLYFLNECKAKYVYCFEPVADTFKILQRNIEINHLKSKTMLINSGVGSKNGKAIISSYKLKNTGATELSMSDDGDVKIVAIDDMRFPDKVGFVKIDVEGFELSVLQGMHNILKKYKPFIMIEIQTKNYDQVNTILTDLYYKKLLLEENGKTMDYFYYQES